jgi:elongation factor P
VGGGQNLLLIGYEDFTVNLPPPSREWILLQFLAASREGGISITCYRLFKKIFTPFMANTADISRGMIIKLDGSLYTVVEFGENKTARAAAKVWAKLKGVDNTRSIEKTWNSGDTIHPVRVERKAYQFLYKDDTGYNFMDNETFEQIALQEHLIDAPQFLKEAQEVSVLINTDTDQPMSVELPDKIVVQVTYSEPGIKGDTATRTLKPAKVETGATVNVPLFVNEGELIRINTKTGEYVERVK